MYHDICNLLVSLLLVLVCFFFKFLLVAFVDLTLLVLFLNVLKILKTHKK